MINKFDLENFINSDLYESALVKMEDVKQVMELGINYDEVPDEYFDGFSEEVNMANASISDLEELLREDLPVFSKFVGARIDFFRDAPYEEEGNDNNNDDELVEILPYYKIFLVGYLVDYFLLKKHPDRLLDYLKKIRMPYAKKHAAQLKEVYNSL